MSATIPPDPPATPPGTGAASVLRAETSGCGPNLVLAHGFTQTGRVWNTMDRDLASDHRVTAVDLPGHGGSSPIAATLPGGSELLGQVGGRAAYLGYSMGARFCLHLALARPDLVESLVLISVTAGIEDADERRERRRSDEALARQLDPEPGSGSAAVPVEVFLRRWMENPMFAGVGPVEGGLEERLTNTGPGLASSLRLAGTGTQQPLWADLSRLEMPVLVITGELDPKFTALGGRLTRAIGPNANHRIVRGAGHAPHLQYPVLVGELVRGHLTPDRGR